ncbi:protein PROCA1 isoform X1 [Marmota marmota marmota]|uniref:Protein interacting with cyclin A1 n=1 Tax=Marmota marmota marmota TaxID=9994 RepID=A0A8C5ZCV3_MARMA|nr:protein PROCA1 isoform X1 [Marmota marmota marmota]
MWVRTTLTIERWTEEKTGCETHAWDKSESSDINRLPSWERGHLLARVASSTDASTLSSEGEGKETDSCCWNHKQCAGHIIHPFSDYGHRNLHVHAVSHCDCDSRLKDCSEKTNSSSSQDTGPTCSRDVESTGFNIIQNPCLECIPEEECVERFWYGWCKSYRPVSVAVIHHPIHHECGADDLNEEEEEEDQSRPPIPTQVGPTTAPTKPCTSTVTGTPDSAAPITIWRSESPTRKNQDIKVIKKIKKKKEKDKEEEMTDEKTKLKKKVKKGKLTKKKSPMKSESAPPDLSRTLSPRMLARMSESSPESPEDLESEDSYNDRGQQEPSSDDIVESSSPRKREKCIAHVKKNRGKTSPTRKVIRRKSPPMSNPNLS